MRRLRTIAIAAVIALLLGACGAGEPAAAPDEGTDTTMAMSDSTMDMTDDTMDMEHEDGFTFGEPADASDADRVVEVTANDDFSFTPSSIEVTPGEIVTFRVTNAGAIPHDFTLGDEEAQDEHEAEMAEMGSGMDMQHDANAMSIEPGETMELTWHFNDSGTVIYGCHQPGHYAAGMKGDITIG